MTTPKLGRLAAAAILSVAAVGGTLAAALPASAAGLPPPKCTLIQNIGFNPGSPGQVIATSEEQCIPGGDEPQLVRIYQYDPSVGWRVVSEGDGYTAYTCKGSEARTYNLGPEGGTSYPCA